MPDNGNQGSSAGEVPYPNEVAPGKYESPLELYPGHIQFPAPLMYPHVQKWWEEAIEGVMGEKRAKFGVVMSEWRAAKMLLLEYGEWGIDNVARGDVADDNVPAEVVNFVMDSADDYVYPKLPPTARRRVPTGT